MSYSPRPRNATSPRRWSGARRGSEREPRSATAASSNRACMTLDRTRFGQDRWPGQSWEGESVHTTCTTVATAQGLVSG